MAHQTVAAPGKLCCDKCHGGLDAGGLSTPKGQIWAEWSMPRGLQEQPRAPSQDQRGRVKKREAAQGRKPRAAEAGPQGTDPLTGDISMEEEALILSNSQARKNHHSCFNTVLFILTALNFD